MEWVQTFAEDGVIHPGEVVAVFAHPHLPEGLRRTLEGVRGGQQAVPKIRRLFDIVVAPFAAPNPIQVGFSLLGSVLSDWFPCLGGRVSGSLEKDPPSIPLS